MRRPPSLAHHLGRWFIPSGMNQLPGMSRTGQRPTRRPGPHEGPAYGVCIHMVQYLDPEFCGWVVGGGGGWLRAILVFSLDPSCTIDFDPQALEVEGGGRVNLAPIPRK